MSQFQNFIRGMPMSLIPDIKPFPIETNTDILKGEVCLVNDAGHVIVATVALSANRKHYVAIEDVLNNPGAAAAKPVPLVGMGQRVTVQTKTILEPGDGVQVSATDGMVGLYLVAGALGLRIGEYIGKEPGVYSKDSAPPFAERYTTDSFPEVNAAVDDIVVIQLE